MARGEQGLSSKIVGVVIAAFVIFAFFIAPRLERNAPPSTGTGFFDLDIDIKVGLIFFFGVFIFLCALGLREGKTGRGFFACAWPSLLWLGVIWAFRKLFAENYGLGFWLPLVVIMALTVPLLPFVWRMHRRRMRGL